MSTITGIMLELLEEAGDLMMLMEWRQKPIEFNRFEDFLETVKFSGHIN